MTAAANDAALNRQAHALLDPAAVPRALTTAEFTAARSTGALIVDARDPQEFAAGHLHGSLNIPADGRFAETAGTVIEPGRRVLVVAAPEQAAETVLRLARVGFDDVAGYLADPQDALVELADQVAPASRLTVPDLHAALQRPAPPLVLDVRNTAERDAGTIADSLQIPLAELPRRLDEIPTDRPIVVHCAGGYRSSVAASLLRAAGHPNVSDLLGGYNAWDAMLSPAQP